MLSANFKFWKSFVLWYVASSNDTASEGFGVVGQQLNLLKSKIGHDFPIPFNYPNFKM